MNIVWLRNDLRINDNPALAYGSENGSICCVYTLTEEQWQRHGDAPAKLALWRARLHCLSEELSGYGIPLKILNAGSYKQVPSLLLEFAQEIKATGLCLNWEYPLNESRRDQQVKTLFEQNGLSFHGFHGDVILPPGSVTTQADGAYHVFTPFAKKWRRVLKPADLLLAPPPRKQTPPNLAADDVQQSWSIGESQYRADLWPADSVSIHNKLNAFLDWVVVDYKSMRDYPAVPGTSTLSPYLACGAISARQCLHKLSQVFPEGLQGQWATELIWREFYRHLLVRYSHLSKSENFKLGLKPIPWQNPEKQWQAWCTGNTGYPIVDAAMRQLLQTGWMHNRLRMIVAAFLTKLLLIDWRQGESFFMSHLLDGDYASNNGGWQWAASTGADSVPYFRIFNPLRQSEKFDAEAKFIKKFIPELAELENKSIHNPSPAQREACGYPAPIIDYAMARQRALDSYAQATSKK